MLSKLRPRSIYDVMAAIACFGVLAGGTAYAANTIRTGDIVDNEVYSADVRNDDLSGGGLASGDIQNGAMTTLEIRDDNQAFGGLLAQDLGPGSVRSSEVLDESLASEDIRNSSLTGSDLVDLTVRGQDIGFNTITGTNVLDGSLEDEDLGVAFVNFTARINAVPAHDCRVDRIDGVGAQGDHMLLTPNVTTGGGRIVYSITYSDSAENAWLTSCNIWSSPITPGDVRFNLLVIDAS